MKKVLIICDSHGGSIPHIIEDNDRYKQKCTLWKMFKGQWNSFVEIIIDNNKEIDMLILSGHTAYNFSNHLELVKKDYSDYHIIFFMGYNDLAVMNGKNIKKTAQRYISQIIGLFDQNDKTVISPLRNRTIIRENEINSQYYEEYVLYIKTLCQEANIKYLDIYELVGDITDQDYRDKDHLTQPRYFPIIDYALSI